MKFIINGNIFFDADTTSLGLVGVNDEVVQISNPATRLLLLLIDHQGETVSREVIFRKVWDNYGMVSSNNNLNQCISKLRRVLKTLGAEDEVISTVPKSGFILLQHISVEDVSGENHPHRPPLSEAENEPDLTLSPSGVEAADQQSVVAEPAAEPKALTRHQKSRGPLSHHWPWIILLLSLVILGMAAALTWLPRSADRTEVYAGIAGKCKVLISQNVLSERNQDELKPGVMAYARRLDPQCDSNEYLLVIKSTSIKPWISGLSRLYVMQCGFIQETKAEICRSLSQPARVPPLS